MEDMQGYYKNYFSQFVGRREEKWFFDTLLEESIWEGFRGLVLSGPPGIGKSRLLYEFSLRAGKRGYPVSLYRFREGRKVPSRITWKHIVEELAESVVSTAPAYTVFEDFLLTVKKLTGTGPVCIFLDNIHLAPELVYDELIEAIDELIKKPVIFVCTYQDLPAYRKGPFVGFLSDVRQMFWFAEHRLEPLDEKDSLSMLERLAGKSLADERKRKIVELSGGNPLFIQEIVRTLHFQEGGESAEGGSFWEEEVPGIIYTAISRRLQKLSSGCVDFIRTLSLVGSRFSMEEVELLLDDNFPESSLDMCLDEALAYGFLVHERDRRHFMFSHSLIHEAIRHTITAADRKQICRKMAVKTENAGLGKETGWAEKLSQWWREGGVGAGDIKKARRYALTAAEDAFLHRNFSLAIGLIKDHVRPGKTEPETLEEADIFYTLAQIKSFGSDTSGAMHYFEKAVLYYMKEKRKDRIQRLSMHPVHLPVGESEIMDMFPRILADAHCTGNFRGMILVQYVGTLINYRGDFKEAERVLLEAGKMSRKTGDAHLKLQWIMTSSYLDYLCGRFYESLNKLEAASNMLLEIGDTYFEPHAAVGKCIVLTAMGKSREAEELIEPMLESVSTLQDSYNLYLPYVTAVRAKMTGGMWRDAVVYLETGLSRYPYNGMLLCYRVVIEYIQGNIERGDTLARYLGALHRGSNSGPWMLHLHASAVQTVRALCTGETDELRKTAAQLRSVISHRNNHPFILVRAHILMCITAALLNDAELAAVHYKMLLQFGRYHLVRPYYRYRALSMAAHCMGNHAKAEDHVKKAIETAIYYRDRPMEAVLHYESAVIRASGHIEEDQYCELRDTLGKVIIKAVEMGMQPLKTQSETLHAEISSARKYVSVIHFHLTKREKEILQLIGEGMSNKDIAAALYISLNTVSNHIKNILGKTGTQNRISAYRAAKITKLL